MPRAKRLVLPPKQHTALQAAHRDGASAALCRRRQMILLESQGRTSVEVAGEVAGIVSCCEMSIDNWVARYQEQGLDGLHAKPGRGRKTILDTQTDLEAVRAAVRSNRQRRGWLRLHAFKPLENDNLLKAGNTLTQRCMRTAANEVITGIDLSGMADGQKAGLCHFAAPHHSTLGVVQEGTTRNLEYKNGGKITLGPILTGKYLWLRSVWGWDGRSQYSYSLDGKTFTDFGEPYQLQWGSYRGDRLGLYSYNNKSEAGYADFDFFRYAYAGPHNKGQVNPARSTPQR